MSEPAPPAEFVDETTTAELVHAAARSFNAVHYPGILQATG
jgi:hypothetical protein